MDNTQTINILLQETNDLSEEKYKVLMATSPICTIDVVFLNPEMTHTLLGKRTGEPYKDVFFAFGGRLRKNEAFEDAAIRIAKQETGIELARSDLTFAGIINEISSNSKFDDINYHAVDIYFRSIVPVDIPITLDKQHCEYRWIPVNDPSLHPNIKKRLSDALNDIQKTRLNRPIFDLTETA